MVWCTYGKLNKEKSYKYWLSSDYRTTKTSLYQNIVNITITTPLKYGQGSDKYGDATPPTNEHKNNNFIRIKVEHFPKGSDIGIANCDSTPDHRTRE